LNFRGDLFERVLFENLRNKKLRNLILLFRILKQMLIAKSF